MQQRHPKYWQYWTRRITMPKAGKKVARIELELVVKEVAKRLNLFEEDVTSVVSCLNTVVADFLSLGDEQLDISVHITDDIRARAVFKDDYVESKGKYERVVPAHMEYSCKFSDEFKQRRYEAYIQSKVLEEAAKRYEHK